MTPCVLIPIYNHGDTIGAILAHINTLSLPCVVVDDGSNVSTQRVLSEAATQYPWLTIVRRSHNGGKGSAVQTGLRHAYRSGYSHAVQVDADGQHNIQDVGRFLQQARQHPSALILGTPVSGSNVPWSRHLGRQISRWCVWLETLSFAIKDPLFGFRVYPLAQTLAVIEKSQLGFWMDFDIEIAVRFYLEGGSVENVDTTVLYPKDGVSHFRMFRDNMHISRLHARLLLRMLRRILSFHGPRNRQGVARSTIHSI